MAGLLRLPWARARAGRSVHPGSCQRAVTAFGGLGGGLQIDLGKGFGVAAQVVAVRPEIAPDPEDAGQRLSGNLRGEGFEGDRPLVASTDEAPEYLLEVDRAGAEITAMRIPGMEVAEEI